MILRFRQKKAFALTLLILSSFIMFSSVILAQNQNSKYVESKGQQKVQYMVKDIHSIEKPYNYTIGKTKFFYLEVLGILAIIGSILFGVFHGFGRYIVHKKHSLNLDYVDKEYIYNIIIRLWHWVNALSVLALIVTGFAMHFNGPTHQLGLVHNIFGVIFVLCCFLFILYELVTLDIKQYIVQGWELREGLLKQALFYAIGIFKQEEHPYHMEKSNRLNPLQKLAYFGVMFTLVPLLACTGIVLLFPGFMGFFVNYIGMANMKYVFILHLISAFGIAAFLFGHIYLATTGDKVKQHFELMITGYHKVYKRIKS